MCKPPINIYVVRSRRIIETVWHCFSLNERNNSGSLEQDLTDGSWNFTKRAGSVDRVYRLSYIIIQYAVLIVCEIQHVYVAELHVRRVANEFAARLPTGAYNRTAP